VSARQKGKNKKRLKQWHRGVGEHHRFVAAMERLDRRYRKIERSA
jgi:hypothetical protein